MSRHDLYGRAHKALRAAMADTLVAVARADLRDDCEAREAVARLEDLLALCEAHARLENRFIHAAMEERRREASLAFAREHASQEREIEALRALAAARSPALYRELALFVARNLLHMEEEEGAGNAALHALFADEELQAIERRLVASRSPAESMAALRWMLPAMNHPERVALLEGLREAPGPLRESVMAVARAHLPPRDFERLAAVVCAEPVA